MTLRICPQPGCPNPQPCPNPEHRPGGWTPDHIRGTKAERGYDTAWERTRQRVLAKARRRCEQCGGPATTVDHRVPLAEGGRRLDPANLRALCEPCHKAKTAADAARGRARAHKERRGTGGEGPPPEASRPYGDCR